MPDLDLGTIVKRARKTRHLSQRDLAKRMECPRTFISKIENGRTTPKCETLCRIGEVLAIDGWRLLRAAQFRARNGAAR